MLSIIVPVYNAEKYLSDCLQSLVNQTENDFEIVLVDDGSTDLSGFMCDEFAKAYDNATVIHTENQGLLLARRTGIKNSKGGYIAFLDSDDCLAPSFVFEIKKIIFEQNKPDLIVFDFSRGEKITYSGIMIKPGLPYAGSFSGAEYDYVKKAVCDGTFNNMANKVIKRTIIGVDDDYSPVRGLMHGEDWLQTIAVVDKAKSAFYLNSPLYFYRISEQSSTHAFRKSQLLDLSVVFDNLLRTSARWGECYLCCARVGACRHLFMLISALATSKAISAEEKTEIMNEIADLIKHVCGNEIDTTLSKLRLDYSLVLRFAVNKKARLSMFCAKTSVGFYNRLSRFR